MDVHSAPVLRKVCICFVGTPWKVEVSVVGCRLVGTNALAAHISIEEAADLEGVVANDFSGQANGALSRKEVRRLTSLLYC